MSKGNSIAAPEILAKLQQARALVDECISGLGGHPPRKTKGRSAPSTRSAGRKSHAVADLDFDAGERAFTKAHAKGLSGPKKFVLLVAFLAKGKVGAEVQLKGVEKLWNRMTALLDGKFNRFYSGSARDNGWVNTKKAGTYILRPSWKDIFH